MRDMILDTNILPEPLFHLIRTEKVKVSEANGIINLIPFVEKDSGCPLWGLAADSTLTADKFLAMKREENIKFLWTKERKQK
jgi:hypothetical protein